MGIKHSQTRKIVCAFAAIALLTTSGCARFKNKRGLDGMTSATRKKQAEKGLPAGGTYQILGKKIGLNGEIVRYNSHLYRGGTIVDSDGVAVLKDMGIRTVISITPNAFEQRMVREGGMELVEIPFGKDEAIPDQALQAFRKAIDEKPEAFYVHGHSGSRRAGALCAAYRVHVQNWSFGKAAGEFDRLGGDLEEDIDVIRSIK